MNLSVALISNGKGRTILAASALAMSPTFSDFSFAQSGEAELPASAPKELVVPAVESSSSEAVYAAGGSLEWIVRQDYASRSFHQFVPELVGYRYDHLSGALWLRTGARAAYAWNQPDMTVSLQVQERDLYWGGDLGVAYNWYAVPVLSLGMQQIVRRISLQVSEPITDSNDRISRTEFLSLGFLHVGVGLPLGNGLVVLEPWGRWLYARDDWRLRFSYGVEFTVRFF